MLALPPPLAVRLPGGLAPPLELAEPDAGLIISPCECDAELALDVHACMGPPLYWRLRGLGPPFEEVGEVGEKTDKSWPRSCEGLLAYKQV